MKNNATLVDLGERHLVRRIKQIVDSAGNIPLILDDAAPALLKGFTGRVFVTTDPCPIPNLVQQIGMGNYYHAGWLCVVKSLSDLAAVGCMPLGVTIAVEFPRNTSIHDFDALFKGASECAKRHGTNILGGNIKETMRSPHAVSFAIGSISHNIGLSRGIAQPGDCIFVIDRSDFGGFWAGIATHLNKHRCRKLGTQLLQSVQQMALMPKAKTKEGIALVGEDTPSFVMDNSDGLLASVAELATISKTDVVLNINNDCFSQTILSAASACACDPRVWALGWGGCQLLCACPPSLTPLIQKKLKLINATMVPIGKLRKGPGCIYFRLNGKDKLISKSPLLLGEQFRPGSFWQHGIKTYTNLILNSTLETIITRK